jgi:hypothetical protein
LNVFISIWEIYVNSLKQRFAFKGMAKGYQPPPYNGEAGEGVGNSGSFNELHFSL